METSTKITNMNKQSVQEFNGMNVMQSQRWICIQDVGNGRHWFYKPSISYRRSDSIAHMLRNTSLTWREAKKKYGWRCSKIFMTLSEF